MRSATPEGFVACLVGDWLMHEVDGYRVIEREKWNTVWLRADDSLTTSP